MKKIISKVILFSSRNYKVLILSILLFLSLLYNFKLKSELDRFLLTSNIWGTYRVENSGGPNPDAEYFVFTYNNSYYKYKQFEVLDKGTFENIYDNVYILKSENTDEYIVYSDKRFHFYDRERNTVIPFTKISDNPLFINIRSDQTIGEYSKIRARN